MSQAGVWLNTGGGWCGPTDSRCDSAAQAYLPTDLNAGYLAEVYPANSLLNEAGGVRVGFYKNYAAVRGTELHFVDLNGDGMVDLLKTDHPNFGGLNAWIHDPSAATIWRQDTRFVPDDVMRTIEIQLGEGDFPGYRVWDHGVRILDFDGDATVDLLRDVASAARQMYISKTAYIDLLESVDNGQGGIHRYSYVSAIAQRDDALEDEANSDASTTGESGAIGIPHWTARPVVNSLVREDTLSIVAPHKTTLKYAMPRWNPESRMQLGFRAVVATQDDGSKTETFFWQQLGRAGRMSRALTRDTAGALVRQKTATWVVIPGTEAEGSIEGVGVVIGRLTNEVTANYYGSVGNEEAGSEQSTTYVYTDGVSPHGYNFVHQIVETRPTGTLTTDRIPEPADTVNWITGEVDKEIQKDGSGDLLSETGFDYDRGLPTMIQRTVDYRHVPTGSVYATTQNIYDEYGNLTETSDPEDRITYLCYDGDATYSDGSACSDGMGGTDSHTVLVSVKDPLGEVTSFVRDLASGSVRILNREYSGDSERVEVDPFGRITEQWALPANQPTASVLTTRAYFDDATNSAGRPYVEERNYFAQRSILDASATIRSAIYQDGFGREIAAVSPKAPGQPHPFGRAITSRDYEGRPLARTLDLECIDADCTNLATYSGTEAVTQTYDALGRSLVRNTPDGVLAFKYSRAIWIIPAELGTGSLSLDAVLSKDPNGNLTEHLFDGDRLVVAKECSNTVSPPTQTDLSNVDCDTPDSTVYTYEATGEVETIYDATEDYVSASHRLRYRYDTLGRTWEVVDPDGGPTTTIYDRVGNIINTTDARSVSISYHYDELDRVDFIDRPLGQGDWDLTLAYDPITRKRASVTSTGTYSDIWEYDDFGFLKKNKRNMNDRILITNFDYDLLGRITRLQTPLTGPEGISYGYNGAYLTSVCSSPNLTDCETGQSPYHVNGVAYDPLGKVLTIHEAPGDLTYQYYSGGDPPEDRAVHQVKKVLFGNKLKLEYDYDPSGAVIKVDDLRGGSSFIADADYTYDRRHRIKSWTDGQEVSRHFKYDSIGNLVGRDLATEGAAENQFYDHPNKPHAITSSSHTGKSYAYDETGNVTQRGTDEYLTYNSMGQVSCVGPSQGSCAYGVFWYDVDGNLLSKTVGATSEIFLGDYFRFDKGTNVAWTYVKAFGRRIVMEKKTAVSLRVASALPTGVLPVDGKPLANAVFTLCLMAILGLWLWLILGGCAAEQPVTASIAMALSVLIAAPPQIWAEWIPEPESLMCGKGCGGGGGGTTDTRYLFHDHLGSEVLAVDEGGNVLERRVFEPFGEVIDSEIDPVAPVPTSFTGKLYHDETSLYNFGARWYDSEVGRFVSVDPVVQTLGDPQTHNPYGYVRNNPVNLVDPDGRCIEGCILIGTIIYYAVQAYVAYASIRSTVERYSGATSENNYQTSRPRDALVAQNTVTLSGDSAVRRKNSTAKNYGAESQGQESEPDAAVPPSPPGISVDENIERVHRIRALDWESAYADWFGKVAEGGEWDYKRYEPIGAYEEFGNFNYGATGRALGFPREVLLRAAGLVQVLTSWRRGRPHGPGSPFGAPPYGDYPEDQPVIVRGIEYYDRYYGNQ